MDLADFLTALFKTGEPSVPPGPGALAMSGLARRALARAYEADAWHFPGPQPAWDAPAAETAAQWFASAAMCYADRSMDATTTLRLLAAVPAPPTAAAHYSADLVLRHLPGLTQLARGLAEDDPAVQAMQRMAWHWPLAKTKCGMRSDGSSRSNHG